MSRRLVLQPGLRRGSVTAPPSKSHAHRLLIANFLSGERDLLKPVEDDGADIAATRRCLAALAGLEENPVLDCGESGSTLRFLAPIAAAIGKHPRFIRRGRLAERPFREYADLPAGKYELPGDVSSQFATGLLFALPLVGGDSGISFTTPLESRGYVEMTLRVLEKSGIEISRAANGFLIPGNQRYRAQSMAVEGDWSGAAAWLAMNALGSDFAVGGLDQSSVQPDRVIAKLLPALPALVDVSQAPDLFPVLAATAAGLPQRTTFTGIRRLRLKECDRVEAMRDVLSRFGVSVAFSEESFVVTGTSGHLRGGEFTTFGDHRIAMAIAVGATRADGPVAIDDADCVAKSYPDFFTVFNQGEIK